ncbi:MAG: M50 family metallopeptidase [Bacteroides sp.]|jgi:hypothetical protein|nr:M50 family metallopeptidase [Bacteroides sp.]
MDKQRMVNVLLLLFLALMIIQVYTFIHEWAHALMVQIFGGQVNQFDVNLFGGSPHVKFSGDFTSTQRALIAIAGPILPVLLWFFLMIFLNKESHLFFQKIAILVSMGIMGTLLPNVIIPLVYETGGNVRGEDMGKFLANTGWNGYAVSALVMLIMGFGIWMFTRKVKFVEALKYVHPIPA